MKIIHAYKVYRPDVEGGIPQVIGMLAGPCGAGFDSEILVARHRGAGRRMLVQGVPVTAVGSLGTVLSMPLAPSYPFALRACARAADLIVHHAPFPLADIAIAAGLPRRVALVVYWHAEIVGRRALQKLLEPAVRRTLDRADRIVVSDGSLIEDSPLLRARHDKCRIVPFGLDIAGWSTVTDADCDAAAELRARHPRLLVAIGRLVPYKGFDVLLDALKHVDAHCIIVGDGPLHDKLTAQAAANGVADRVTFAGRIAPDDIRRHLQAAQALVMPSVSAAEAFGLVQVEAMAAGRAVVNTQLSTGVPHVARHGREALTVPVGDAVALAAEIRRLFDEPGLAERLGAAGRARAQAEYSQDAYCRRIRTVFDEALAARAQAI